MQSTQNRDHAVLLQNLASGQPYETKSAELADSITQIADRFEAFKDRIETRMSRPGFGTETTNPAAGPEERRIAKPTAAEIKAFGGFLRTGDRSQALESRATINASTSNQGLEAVVPWFDQQIRSMARDYTPMLRRVSSTRVSNFPVKHVVGDPTAMGSGWISELGIRNDSDTPAPRVVTVDPGEWYALPAISEWALSDVNFDVVGWLQRELVSEYSETLQNAIVSGNGTNKPKGFLDGTPVTTADGAGRAFGVLQYYPTGVAATLPATTSAMIDLLITVVHGLKARHRRNASWAASALTLSTLRKFKDVDGRPILLDSMTTGQPATLLGYPVDEVEVMPAIGAGTFPLAFGDFNAGYVLDEEVTGVRITRDDVTSKGLVKFYSRTRCGGAVLDSEAIKLIKVSVA